MLDMMAGKQKEAFFAADNGVNDAATMEVRP